MWLSDYFRKKESLKYPERFIQGVDYKKIDHPIYKYEMLRDRAIITRQVGYKVNAEHFSLNEFGLKIIRAGYRSDGPSGPTVDTPSFMRSAFSHDVDFQILRSGLIPDRSRDKFFHRANLELRRISKEDGMMWPRYHWVYMAVNTKYARKRSDK